MKQRSPVDQMSCSRRRSFQKNRCQALKFSCGRYVESKPPPIGRSAAAGLARTGFLVWRSGSGGLCRHRAPARTATLDVGVIAARIIAVVPILLRWRPVLSHDRRLCRIGRPRWVTRCCIRIWIPVAVPIAVSGIRIIGRVGIGVIGGEAKGESKPWATPATAPAAAPAAAVPIPATAMPPSAAMPAAAGAGRRGERKRA